jgi:hypothetical protein
MVGWRGGGGADCVGLTALTAASFCVFLTLETSIFFAEAVLRAAVFGAGLLALAATFGFAAAFRAAALRAAGLAAAARFAFGLAATGFALTARFAVFAVAFFAFERVGDRRKPFVRLLLMGGISKGCSPYSEQPPESPAAYHSFARKSTNTSICGCFNLPAHGPFFEKCQQRKTLEGHCWLC